MKTKYLFGPVFLVGFLILCCANLYAENIDPDEDGSQYAYSQNIGWLNFEPNEGPGVTVTTNRLIGYVWVPNIGWVSFSCRNTDSCGTVDYEVVNDGSGNLSGYAWGANVGWINFNPNYGGVTIDGEGVFDGWAYGQNIGWLHFQSVSPVPYRVKARVIGLLVLTPNGAEELIDGSMYQITWQTTGTIDDVVVEYSTNNGTDWTEVDPANTGNDDYYDWLVPAEPSTECLVRISDLSNSNISDISDAVFTILPPSITVLTPNGGEVVPIDAYYTVTWQTQGTVSGVVIWYSTNNGIDWAVVVPPNTGNIDSYDWFAPHVSSNQCLVYIASAADSNTYDISDRVFSLITETAGFMGGWGSDTYGQLGDMPDSSNLVAISSGWGHGLALQTDGSLAAWGSDDYNQVADIPDSNDFVAVAAGWWHNLALKADGCIVGWGFDVDGRATPPDGNDFVAIVAGGFSLALKADGSIVAWGGDGYNQVTDVPDGNDFVAIAAGGWHGLALKSDGSIVGWGRDDYGQSTPQAGNDFVAIAAGRWHSLALKADGSLAGWGRNNEGQINIPPGQDYVAVYAGIDHGLALKSDGSIVGWGRNDVGQATPPAGYNFTAIAAGGGHSLAMYECKLSMDLNGDCYVNLKDFAVFALEWLECNNPFDVNCVP